MVSNSQNVAGRRHKLVRPVKECVLPLIDGLVGAGCRVDVEGNVVQRDARFVVLWIQEILKHMRRALRVGQGQRHKFHFGCDFADRFHNRVVTLDVLHGRRLVFAVNLVEDLEITHVIVMPGGVKLPQFVSKPALRVPTDKTRVVVRQRLHVAQFLALRVIPHDLIEIVGIRHRLRRGEHPLGNRAEAPYGRMSVAGRHKIVHDRVDVLEIPVRLGLIRRPQLSHRQPGIRKPESIAHIVALQAAKRGDGGIVGRRPPAQHRIHHRLQRG